MKKKYLMYSASNLIIGLCAIILYLPYTFRAFNISGFDWLDIAPDLFKSNYYNVLIGFGIFAIVWLILINTISLINYPNLPKTLFKLSVVVALSLPLMYVLAIRFDWALKFWLKNISKNIKTISYATMFISCGLAILGILYNITRRKHANFHHLLQAITMCAMLVLLVLLNGWCWHIGNIDKIFGLLMGVFAVYFPISSLVLYLFRKIRY